MRIENIKIRNYRSINNVSFTPRQLNVFVGENDSGKTNILRALEFFFNPNNRPTSADKNLNVQSNKIEVEIKVSSLSKHWKAQLSKSRLIGEDRTVIKKVFYFGKKSKSGYFDYKGNQIPDSMVSRLLSGTFLYVPVLRDIKAELSGETSDVYRKIVRGLIRGMSGYSHEKFGDAIREATDNLDKYTNRELKNLKTVLNELVPNRRISLTIMPEVEDLFKELKVKFKKDHSALSIFHKGQGLQSLVTIGFYRAWAERGRGKIPFLAIEEPELHLHPHLINNFLDIILKMSSTMQVFLTTHSPIVLNKCEFPDIVRVEKNKDKTVVKPFKSMANLDEKEVRAKISVDKAQIFFAHKVVLCEGQTEEHILPEFSAKLDDKYNFYKKGICILPVDGGSFEKYMRLLRCYNIPFILMGDFHCWESGSIEKAIRALGLRKRAPRVFDRLVKNKASMSQDQDQVMRDLKKLGCICLKKNIENLLLTCNQKEIVEIMKDAVPGKYKATVGGLRGIASEKQLLSIMEKSKPVWARAIGRQLNREHISDDVQGVIRDICTLKPP